MRRLVLSTSMSTKSPWPKTIPQLTVEQERIREDFVRYSHEVLAQPLLGDRAFQPRLRRRQRAPGSNQR